MILSETNQTIKDNLHKFMNGDFNDKLDDEQVKKVIEISFLFNHLSSIDSTLIFRYNEVTIRINISDAFGIPQESFHEEALISMFLGTDDFKRALSTFIRDYKLGKILD